MKGSTYQKGLKYNMKKRRKIFYITMLLVYCLFFLTSIYVVKAQFIVDFIGDKSIYWIVVIIDLIIGLIVLSGSTFTDFKKILNAKKEFIFNTFKGVFILFLPYILLIITFGLPHRFNTNFEISQDISLRFYLTSIFIVPFFEEAIFRFAIRKLIDNKIIYIFVSSIIFMTVHVHLYGNMAGQISILYTGILLAFVYLKYENIYINYIIHMINNVVALFLIILGFGSFI